MKRRQKTCGCPSGEERNYIYIFANEFLFHRWAHFLSIYERGWTLIKNEMENVSNPTLIEKESV